MRIGYDITKRHATVKADRDALLTMIDALNKADVLNEIMILVPFGKDSAISSPTSERTLRPPKCYKATADRNVEDQTAESDRTFRCITAHRVFTAMPRVWRNLRMPAHLKQNEVDIYHALTGEIPMRMAYSPQKRVVSIGNVDFLLYPDAYSPWDRFSMRCRCYFSCRVAHRIIAADERTRTALEQFGIEREKITVMLAPVYDNSLTSAVQHKASSEDLADDHTSSTKEIGTEMAAIKRKYELFDRYFVMTGEIIASRSYRESIDALNMIYRDIHSAKPDGADAKQSLQNQMRETDLLREDFGLVIIGRHTEYADKILAYAHTLGLAGRVNILYEPDTNDLPAIMSMSQGLLILPQRQISGSAILQAVQAGIPIISSDRHYLREVAGDAALYVDPFDPTQIADAMRKLMHDNDTNNSLHRAAILRREFFSAEKVAEKLMNLYKSL